MNNLITDAENELALWAGGFLNAQNVISRPSSYFAAPPAAESSDERLEVLLTVWEKLQIDERYRYPARAAAQRLGNGREALVEVIVSAIDSIDREIQKCLGAGVRDDRRIICTADFGAEGCKSFTMSGQQLYAGLIDSLPREHYLKLFVEDDDYYRIDLPIGPKPCVILGLPIPVVAGNAAARPWYTLASTLVWTRQFRTDQKAKEDEKATRERREAEASKREWLNSPLGELETKLAALERVKAGEKPVVRRSRPRAELERIEKELAAAKGGK